MLDTEPNIAGSSPEQSAPLANHVGDLGVPREAMAKAHVGLSVAGEDAAPRAVA